MWARIDGIRRELEAAGEVRRRHEAELRRLTERGCSAVMLQAEERLIDAIKRREGVMEWEIKRLEADGLLNGEKIRA